MSLHNRHHLSTNGGNSSASRFARHAEILPHSIQTAVSFLSPYQGSKPRGAMMDGKFRVYWANTHRSAQGVKYNRLLRLRRRLFINREQGGRVNR
jgi:hypothetical protein